MAEEKKKTKKSEESEERPASDVSAEKEVKKDPIDELIGSSAGGSDEATDQKQAVKVKTKTRGVVLSAGVAHIKASFNNTMVVITDMKGGVISWSSAGKAGFKGSRKSTAFAATMVGQDAARQAVAKGMREVEVLVQGAGSGRESAVRALQSAGLNISVIKDVTPVPHNGCRPRKRRRV